MINGTLSKILYIGAWITIFILVVVYGFLSYNEKTIPPDLSYLLVSLVSFLVGTHIMPPGEGKNGSNR